MKRFAVPLVALGLGITAVLVFVTLAKVGMPSVAPDPLIEIGTIQTITGEVHHRLPRAVQVEPLTAPSPLFNRELLITGRGEATVSFPKGATLKLSESTKFVAEIDATKTDAVIATVLSGQVAVTQPGEAGYLRLFSEGREINLSLPVANSHLPIIPVGPRTQTSGDALVEGGETGAATENGQLTPPAVAATTSEESLTSPETTPTPAGTPPKQLPTYRESRKKSAAGELLSNDEITRELSQQSVFLRRCYLTFINRTNGRTNATAKGSNQKAGITGTVTVGFSIQSNGRVSSAKVVRSDFKDETLHKCVLETVERTSFRAPGETTAIAEFPIRLQ